MSKSGDITTGYKYFMDMQMSLCRGPIDVLLTINVGDIEAWNNELTVTGDFAINQPELFGGDKAEGGIDGTVTLYLGDGAQTYQSGHKALMGGLVPEFRGVTTVWFSGTICSNNPYPKTWKFRAARNLAGWQADTPWYPQKAMIVLPGLSGENGSIRAQNPAHIIYECLTNSVWGKGNSTTLIDEDSFTDCANQLCSEGFGLCFKWDRSNNIDDFISNVINHINASLYTDRATGKICLFLIRGNYTRADLPLFDATSGLLSVQKGQTGSSNGVNEVVVQFTDMTNKGQQGSTRWQALGAIMAANGQINSATTAYMGIPTLTLAQRVAQRDCTVSATPLQVYTLTMDRRAWKIFGGMPFRISSPENAVNDMVVRAGKIVDTTLKDGTITLNVVQDVFDLPATTYVQPETHAWVAPVRTPILIDYRSVGEADYRTVVQRLSPGDLAALEIVSGALAIMAKRPGGTQINYDVLSRQGTDDFADRYTGDFTPHALLTTALGPYDDTVSYGTVTDVNLSSVAPGKSVQIGGEIMAIFLVDKTTNTMVVVRGCVDSLPVSHGVNADIFWGDSFTSWDTVEYTLGDSVDVELLSRTSTALLSPEFVDADTVDIVGRQGLPYPPGNLKMGGTLVYSLGEDVYPGDLVFTWARRNRVTQVDTLVGHTNADITPEAGQTVTVRILDGHDGTLLDTITGITGTTWTYDSTEDTLVGSPSRLRFQVLSSRGGSDSLNRYDFDVQRTAGFGYDFGEDYGRDS